jgi:ElaB/YqjD/DUF883 family membrane-anchored ribosome-binding protein
MNTYKEKELENAAKEKINEFGSSATSAIRQGEERSKDAIAELERKLRQGQDQIKQVASTVDKQLHSNPWPIVSAVAVGAVFLGFIMGTSSRRND